MMRLVFANPFIKRLESFQNQDQKLVRDAVMQLHLDVMKDGQARPGLRWHALDGNEYDDVFTALERRPDGWTEAGIRYPDRGLQLIVEASPEFREWVIFAPLSRSVVCLEPYTGTTNAVNLQNQGVDAGLVVVQPGAAWRGTIRTLLRRDI